MFASLEAQACGFSFTPGARATHHPSQRLQILPASLAIDGAHVLENEQCFETLDDTTETAVARTVATATFGAPARGRLIEPGW